MKKNYKLISILLVLISIVFIYKSIGLYVIQPIGIIPEGITIIYLRWNPLEPNKYVSVPFIESADGRLLRTSGKISLLARIKTMSEFMDVIQKRILFKLPYYKQLYLISTDGKQFED